MTSNAPENQRPHAASAARALFDERYSTARLLFCGGSVVRGEGRESSDLDVVVLYDRLDHAFRESFYFQGWPVEVFVHDPETLAYFVESDCKRGRPSLAQMLAEALVVPAASAQSRAVQRWAARVLEDAPPAPPPSALDGDRYAITDLLNDFRDDRPLPELTSVACELYPLVANFVLRAAGSWVGSGKFIPRLLSQANPGSGDTVTIAFQEFFRTGDKEPVVRAVRTILEPFGGELFDGYHRGAPAAWRLSTGAALRPDDD